jgi:hypothetical protein
VPHTDAEKLARKAAARAHLAKNGFQEDLAFARLSEAIENLALAVAELAKTHDRKDVGT